MERGNLSQWKVKVGDRVTAGSVMAEVETDKATVAFESVEDGFIAKILVPSGTSDVAVNTPVAILVENSEDVAAFENYSTEKNNNNNTNKKNQPAVNEAKNEIPQTKEKSISTSSSDVVGSISSVSDSSTRQFASPAARRISSELGVSLSGVAGTGPDNRIIAADVKEAAEAGAKNQKISSAPVSSSGPAKVAEISSLGDFVDLPNSNIRKVIASRLLQSKQNIPHYYLTIESNVDRLMKVRSDLNAQLATGGESAKLSVNDFIIKAAALACRKVPAVNSSWNEQFIRQYNYVDISVAVSTDTGLVTPIIKDADIKGLTGISQDTKSLAAKARANKLQPHEYQGGTFTISNLGMFGVKNFSAIINPPQAAILAVGTAETRVVPNPANPAQPFTTSQFLSVTLSCDHRVIDGAVGAQWLKAFKEYIENPLNMLL